MDAALFAKLSVSHLRQRVRVLARQLGVRMLIIDEIHSMLSGTFREQRIFLNALRFLANDLRLPLVCVGTPEAKQALLTDQQLADRFEARELPAWRDDVTFHQFLANFGASLPLRQASGPLEVGLRKRILSLSEGITVRICRLLEEAAVQAILSGRERIELETLSEELLTRSLVSISERRQRVAVSP
jgi:Bacterial TniB protein